MTFSAHKQQGVALITALLIAALVTVVAVAMASRQQLDIRRTGNMLEADQAYMYALAAETWASQVLQEDRGNTQIDTLLEPWAMKLPPIPIEGGVISGSVEDMQGRFNLNNLSAGASGGAAGQAQVRILQSLLRQLNAADPKVQLPAFIPSRVTDWIDSDLNPLADGAEDLWYLGIDKLPYRAANRPMASASELAAVAGVSLRDMAVLERYVTALPNSTPINVNTASEMLLMSLDNSLTPRIAKELVSYRLATPFENGADFARKMQDDYGITLVPALVPTLVSASSEYFLVTSDAAIGRTKLRLYSLLERSGNNINVLSRGIGSY